MKYSGHIWKRERGWDWNSLCNIWKGEIGVREDKRKKKKKKKREKYWNILISPSALSKYRIGDGSFSPCYSIWHDSWVN